MEFVACVIKHTVGATNNLFRSLSTWTGPYQSFYMLLTVLCSSLMMRLLDLPCSTARHWSTSSLGTSELGMGGLPSSTPAGLPPVNKWESLVISKQQKRGSSCKRMLVKLWSYFYLNSKVCNTCILIICCLPVPIFCSFDYLLLQ